MKPEEQQQRKDNTILPDRLASSEVQQQCPSAVPAELSVSHCLSAFPPVWQSSVHSVPADYPARCLAHWMMCRLVEAKTESHKIALLADLTRFTNKVGINRVSIHKASIIRPVPLGQCWLAAHLRGQSETHLVSPDTLGTAHWSLCSHSPAGQERTISHWAVHQWLRDHFASCQFFLAANPLTFVRLASAEIRHHTDEDRAVVWSWIQLKINNSPDLGMIPLAGQFPKWESSPLSLTDPTLHSVLPCLQTVGNSHPSVQHSNL